jgi:hypothetical protein
MASHSRYRQEAPEPSPRHTVELGQQQIVYVFGMYGGCARYSLV